MFYYAVKSLKRQTGRYIRILCILVLAMIIPIIVNIIGSSSVYGEQKQSLSMTNGMDYRIDHATQELIKHFEADNHFDVIVKDNSLFLRYHLPNNSAEHENKNNSQEEYQTLASHAIRDILNEVGLSSLQIYNLTAINQVDPHTSEFMSQINTLSFVIILISVIIFQAGYKAHIHNFTDEIDSLHAIGCSYRKICIFFLWTLTVCFIIAYILAIIISYFFMKILYSGYLNVQSSGYAWMLFHVDWASILLLAIMWYVLLLIIYIFQMISNYRALTGKKRRILKKKRALSTYGIKLLPIKILWNRYGQSIRHGILLAILTLFISVFLINYASINSESIKDATEGDYSISYHRNIANLETGISEEVKEKLQAIKGIHIDYQKSISTTQYLAAVPHRHSPYAVIENGDQEYIQTIILRNSDIQTPELFVENNYVPVWINQFQPVSDFSVGDVIDLYVYDPASMVNQTIPDNYTYGHPFLTEKICLKVYGYTSEKYMDTPLRLSFLPEDYNKLTERYPVISALIKVNPDTDKSTVKSQLTAILENTPDYDFTDLNEKRQIASQGSVGIYILAAVITVLFIIIICLVIWILFSEYVIQQKTVNELLFFTGLSINDLKHVYKTISYKAYCISILIGIITAVLASLLFFSGTGYGIVFTPVNIMIYCILFAAFAFVMIIPMQIEINKQFKSKEAT